MQGELEQSAFVVRRIELAAKNIENCGRRRIGPKRLAAVHPEIHRVIAHPLDRQFDDAAWLAIEQQLMRQFSGAGPTELSDRLRLVPTSDFGNCRHNLRVTCHTHGADRHG